MSFRARGVRGGLTWSVERSSLGDVEDGSLDGEQDPLVLESIEGLERLWGVVLEKERLLSLKGDPGVAFGVRRGRRVGGGEGRREGREKERVEEVQRRE